MSPSALPPYGDRLAWALAYARAGYPVVALHGKKPALFMMGDRPFSSVEERVIRMWWERRHWAKVGTNVGIETGTASGLLVLDIDADQGGWETLTTIACLRDTDEWRSLERIIEWVRSPKDVPGPKRGVCGHTVNPPESLTGLTGMTNLHCYFALPSEWPPGYVGGEFAPGLTLRCDNDYVVAPPSVHPDRWRRSVLRQGRYTWGGGQSLLEQAPPTAPNWLLEQLRRLAASRDAAGGTGESVGGRA